MKWRKRDPSGRHPGRSDSLDSEWSADILRHELDNVLNGLLGMTRLLRDSGLSPEQDRWSRAIEQSGRQMRRLVSSFRQGGGSPREIAEYSPRPGPSESVDGVDLLEQAVISQTPCTSTRRNRLLLTVDPRLPRFWRADPCRLRQLLDNLLGNANKFCRDGEILLEASLAADGGSLVIAVTDTGPGVEAGEGQRIFEAWEQGSEAVGRRYGGSGLGLYVCSQAVSEMGGAIRVMSPPGSGARFEVMLPGPIAPGAGSDPPLSRLFSLLECRVDLEGSLRQSVDSWLVRLGVSKAGDGSAQQGDSPARLELDLSEPFAPGVAGPLLLFRPTGSCAPLLGPRRLAAPIIGSSLGPVLLEIVLEWLWLRRGRPG